MKETRICGRHPFDQVVSLIANPGHQLAPWIRVLALALLWAVLTPRPAVSDTTTVVLREHCSVEAPVVRLSDVAISADLPSLSHLQIAKAPVPGGFATLSADQVRARVEQALGFRTPVRVVGASTVRIYRKAQTLTPERVAAAIRQRVSRELPGGSRCEVELLQPLKPAKLPWGDLTLRTEPLGRVRPGRISFRIDCLVGGSLVRSLAVTARMRVYRKVVVAARDIPAGMRITADAIRVEEREFARRIGSLLSEPERALGKEARVTIRRGMPLTERLLRQAPLVRRGDRVRLVVNFGSVTAETYGRALQEGVADATILVRNEGSGRTVRGRVAGPGLVLVSP